MSKFLHHNYNFFFVLRSRLFSQILKVPLKSITKFIFYILVSIDLDHLIDPTGYSTARKENYEIQIESKHVVRNEELFQQQMV